MRKTPQETPPDVPRISAPPAGMIRQEREYRLITPLFGGGVEPGVADPVTIIRGPSIRGQLRFWWRACRGGVPEEQLRERPWSDDDLRKDMKEREVAIWGAASDENSAGPSQVQVEVAVTAFGTKDQPYEIIDGKPDWQGRIKKRSVSRRGSSTPLYAAFPLQPSEEEAQQEEFNPKSVRLRISFTLTITFPERQKYDVGAALWAWETFGGIGARTRRGFGSLNCIAIKTDGASEESELSRIPMRWAEEWLQQRLEEHVVSGQWPDAVPHLTCNLLKDGYLKLITVQQVQLDNKRVMQLGKEPAIAIWWDLIERLNKFRQLRYKSDKGNVNHPGRSFWPEPSAIRDLIGQSHPDHKSPIPNPSIRVFPRAAFGLPIGFQFKDANRKKHALADPNSDPRKTVLQLKDYERLSSPLILKPLSVSDSQAIGMALVLEGAGLTRRLPDGHLELRVPLILKALEGPAFSVSKDIDTLLTAGQAAALDREAMSRGHGQFLNNEIDILQAFLKTLP